VGTGILDEDDEGEGAGGVGGVVIVGGFATEGVLVGPTGKLVDGLMDKSQQFYCTQV